MKVSELQEMREENIWNRLHKLANQIGFGMTPERLATFFVVQGLERADAAVAKPKKAKKKTRKPMSAEARALISQRQKERYAKLRAEKAETPAPVVTDPATGHVGDNVAF